MTEDADQERLERLRGDLADLRERASAVSAAEASVAHAAAQDGAAATGSTSPADSDDGAATDAAATPDGRDREDGQGWREPRSFSARPSRPRRRRRAVEVQDRPTLSASREGTTREAPTDVLGRPRVPRPRRRNPLRRKPRKPPRRLAVPAPIPVQPRPSWLAAPRWPVLDWVSGVVIFLVLAPAVAQLGLRLYTAMERTSFLLGADPTRLDMLQAAAGVAGGGITLSAALLALAIVRGRPGYAVSVVAVLLLFVGFPYMAYTANAGIVAAPIPSLGEMIQPAGWPRLAELQTAFVIAITGLVLATGDLIYRSVAALVRTAGAALDSD